MCHCHGEILERLPRQHVREVGWHLDFSDRFLAMEAAPSESLDVAPPVGHAARLPNDVHAKNVHEEIEKEVDAEGLDTLFVEAVTEASPPTACDARYAIHVVSLRGLQAIAPPKPPPDLR